MILYIAILHFEYSCLLALVRVRCSVSCFSNSGNLHMHIQSLGLLVFLNATSLANINSSTF